MSKKILGLDIRYDSVSAVLLATGLKGNAVESFIHVKRNETAENETGIATALQEIVEKMDLTDAVCIASIPAEDISFRNLRVPFKDHKKISQILPLELEPVLPYNVSDLLLDFQIIPVADNSESTEIIAAAIKKSILEGYIADLAAFGIQPRIIVAGGCHTALCLNHFSDIPKDSMVMDIDTVKATLIILVSGQIKMIRSIKLHSQGEKRVEILCTDIQRTLAAYETLAGPEFNPEAAFMTGSGSDAYDYQDRISTALNLPVNLINLVQNADAEINDAHRDEWHPRLMDNAFALAMTDITGNLWLNFSQRRFTVKKQWAEHKKRIITSGILAGVVLFLAVFNMVFDFYLTSKQVENLDERIHDIFKTSFPEVTRVVDPLQQMKVKLKELKDQSALSDDTGSNILSIDILNNISRMIPDSIDAEFERLVIGPDNILVSGDTATFNNVDDIKSRLEKEAMFEKVDISSANTDKSVDRVRFKLKIILLKGSIITGNA